MSCTKTPDKLSLFVQSWLEHCDNKGNNGLGCVVLPALLALSAGELAKEVFVDVAEDILGLERFVVEGEGSDEVDSAHRAYRRPPSGRSSCPGRS